MSEARCGCPYRRVERLVALCPGWRQNALIVSGSTDVIVPPDCVHRAVDVLTGARVRYETAPGSHLGVLTGPTAPTTTWVFVRDFLRQQAETEVTGRGVGGVGSGGDTQR